MTNTKPKTKIFRVNSDIGTAFRAVAELKNLHSNDLLEDLMSSYVLSAQKDIASVADINPAFASKYPFIDYPDEHSTYRSNQN